MENHNNKQPANAAAKTWLALVVFSSLAVIVFAVLLYKAIEVRFNPAPRPQAQVEEPQQNPFQNIASSGAISAAPIETPAVSPISVQKEVAESTTAVAAVPPAEETTAEADPAGEAPAESAEQQQEQRPTPTPEPPAKPKARKVRFVYNGKASDSVKLSGTFISWKTTEMKRVKGKWVAELYMGPGTYRYCFIVNGVKTPDPLQPLRQGGHSLAVVR